MIFSQNQKLPKVKGLSKKERESKHKETKIPNPIQSRKHRQNLQFRQIHFLIFLIVSYILFKIVAVMVGGLRVTNDQESQGLDIVDHEERGYDI